MSQLHATYGCPVSLALDVLGGKWRVVLLAYLKEGPHRYGELRRRVPRMSEKMLTQRLRELVEANLVTHDAGVYALSAEGESARPVLEALYAWGSAIAPQLGFTAARVDREEGSPSGRGQSGYTRAARGRA